MLVPVSRRTRLAAEAHGVRETDESGRLSYARTGRRCSIKVSLTCSTTHRFALGRLDVDAQQRDMDSGRV